MVTQYICTYPFYRSFQAGCVYEATDKDKMTGLTVEQWATQDPKYWTRL